MDPMTGLSLLAALGLAAVHLVAGRLRDVGSLPRSRWLSAAGGVSVAYVFLHLLPELSVGQDALKDHLGFLEERAYLLALLGLSAFYGLEHAALRSRRRSDGGVTGRGTFWVHVVSFALYNALIGYLLLHREDLTALGLLWYALAIGLHFLVNDYALREHHQHQYHHVGRWLLSGAVLLGWALGTLVALSEALLAGLLAFVAGGIVLNVLKEELPEGRESRFWAFALGAGGYTVLLLAL